MIVKFLCYFAAPVFDGDEEKSRIASLLNVIALSSLFGAIFYLPFAAPERVPYVVIAIGVILVVWLSLKRGYVRFASIALVVGLFLIFVATAFTGGGVRAPAYSGLLILILVTGLLLGWKAAIGMTVFSILYGVVLLRLDWAKLLPSTTDYSARSYLIINSVFFIMACVLLTLSIQLVNSTMRRLNKELAERRRAEERSLQSEERFSKAFHSTPTALALTRLSDSKFEYVNESFLTLVQYELDEVIGRSPAEINLFPRPDQLQKVRELLFEAGKVRNLETTIRSGNDELRDILFSVDIVQLNGEPYSLTTMMDITERILAEKQVLQIQRMYATLSQVNLTIVRIKDRDDLYKSICDVAVQFGQFTLAWIALLDQSSGDVQPVAANGLDIDKWPFPIINIHNGPMKNGLIATAIKTSKTITTEDILTDDRLQSLSVNFQHYAYHSLAAIPFQLRGKTIGALGLAYGEAGFFKATEERRLLEEMGADISFALDALETEKERQLVEEALRNSEAQMAGIFNSAMDAIISTDSNRRILIFNPAAEKMFRCDQTEAIGESLDRFIPLRFRSQHAEFVQNFAQTGATNRRLSHLGTIYGLRNNGEEFPIEASLSKVKLAGLDLFTVILRDITDRKKAEDALKENARLLSEAQRIGNVGSWSYNIIEDAIQFSDEMYRLLDTTSEKFQHNKTGLLSLIYAADLQEATQWMELIISGRQPKELEFRTLHKNGELRFIQATGAVITNSNWNPVRFTGMMQDITERKLTEIQIRQQIDRLYALRTIDIAITSSFDLRYTLDAVLSQVIKQLHVDAADILILDPRQHILVYALGKGFRTKEIETVRLAVGNCHADRVIKERRLVKIENSKDQSDELLMNALLAAENFVCYYGVPLIATGKVEGVLEIFHGTPLQTYPEWLDFLEALAGQAAIAIENAMLFENLQESNRELMQAYDDTIEGWSRALDLRDRETEGHTQRVSKLTIDLARQFGFTESQLVDIRWGALLHDIGKMGVPDSILFKPGQLSEDEWASMRKHPAFAFEMLSPISYLRSALDIPYCHHERWDGSGYPRGLKGDQIPLAARIFAIADVWDAVTSDRPYRKGWSKKTALAYIKKQSGEFFDPQVVEMFLKIIA